MGIQWENFNGTYRGLIIDVNILIEKEDGTSGWGWFISSDIGAVRDHGEVRFPLGDDVAKQAALDEVLQGLEAAGNDVLTAMETEAEEYEARRRRWDGPDYDDTGRKPGED